jgi:uncharacterized protein
MDDLKYTRKELCFFLCITFGIAWIVDFIRIFSHSYFVITSDLLKVLSWISAASPLIGLLVTKKVFGASRKKVWKDIFYIPHSIYSYFIVCFFMGWRFLAFFIGGMSTFSGIKYFLIVFCYEILFEGGLEEPGWRGYLQEYFNKKHSFIVSTIIVSIIWAIWHIPLWFITGTSQHGMNIVVFYLQLLVNSFTLAFIKKSTKNNVFCVLFHAWANAVFLSISFKLSIIIIVAYTLEAFISIVCSFLYDKFLLSKTNK